MRSAAVALLLALLAVFASEPAFATKRGAQQGGSVRPGHVNGHRPPAVNGHRPPAVSGHHPHHGGHHHGHGVTFVGVGVVYPYWWYPPPYYYYPPPVAYPGQPVTYIEQGGAPAAVDPSAWWYYCEFARGYYPHVQQCPGGWIRVPPSPPPY